MILTKISIYILSLSELFAAVLLQFSKHFLTTFLGRNGSVFKTVEKHFILYVRTELFYNERRNLT